MNYFCTYCSAAKSTDEGDLPAIERYLDPRIHAIYGSAQRAGKDFVILSGEYGLLLPTDPIPYYDHLLTEGEVDRMAARVAGQINSLAIGEIDYFTATLEDDPLVAPYLEVIRRAARSAGVGLRINYV